MVFQTLRKQPAPAPLAVLALIVGCGPDGDDPHRATPKARVRISVEQGSPLAEALRLRLAEWESQGRGQVIVEERPIADTDADLRIVSGHSLARLEHPVPLSDELLRDRQLEYLQLPPLYRLVFGRLDSRAVAIPLTAEMLVVWYRADLFEDAEIAEEYRRRTENELRPPSTWEEYLRLARFFSDHAAVRFGCAEAMDESPAAVRNFLAHCAAYAKGPDHTSFLFDTETGQPLLAGEAFVRGLSEWIEASRCSPARDGSVVDAQAARRAFLDGQAAMLLEAGPPVDPSGKGSEMLAKIASAPLPSSRTLYDPRTGQAHPLEQPNQCVHLAGVGWFVALGRTGQRAAAESLMRFLCDPRESTYLVQGCRRGLVPIRPGLLNEPERFRGYGLPVSTTSRFFAQVSAGVRSDNWVADVRGPLAGELQRRLASRLREAMTGKLSPRAALEAAAAEWNELIEPKRQEFLDQHRQTLGLPPLAR